MKNYIFTAFILCGQFANAASQTTSEIPDLNQATFTINDQDIDRDGINDTLALIPEANSDYASLWIKLSANREDQKFIKIKSVTDEASQLGGVGISSEHTNEVIIVPGYPSSFHTSILVSYNSVGNGYETNTSIQFQLQTSTSTLSVYGYFKNQSQSTQDYTKFCNSFIKEKKLKMTLQRNDSSILFEKETSIADSDLISISDTNIPDKISAFDQICDQNEQEYLNP